MLWEPVRTDIITILGCGQSVYDWVNLNSREFQSEDQVWVVNPGCRLFYHHVCFDMHDDAWLANKSEPIRARMLARRKWMITHDKPIVMPKASPGIPMSRTYPLPRIVRETSSNYFADGTSYMLAAAYWLKPKVLRTFGMDYTMDREGKTHGEPGEKCANYWIGRIKESGVQVEMSKNTHFMDQAKRSEGHFYGYSEAGKWVFDHETGKGMLTNLDYADQ